MSDKKLGFGFMRLPLLGEGKDPTQIDIKQVKEMVDLFLKKGFTYFDTAYFYHNGTSESVLKEVLVDRHERSHFKVATKLPMAILNTIEERDKIFDEQLSKTGADYFDYYLLHCLNSPNYKKAEELDCFNFIKEKKEEGKIKKIGFSYHDKADLLEEILKAHPEIEFVQLQINYIDWESESIQSKKCYEVCEKHGKPVIVMEPVKGGILAKVPEEAENILKEYSPVMSVPSWAVRYAAGLDNVMMVLSGMSNMEQLKDNTGYMEEFEPLNQKENEIIEKVSEIINSSIAVPCTACSYCIDGCPMNIQIPDYFSLYNSSKQFGFSIPLWIYYMNYINDGHGRASECISCKKCEEKCPQHLNISELMKDVSEVFDIEPSF